MSKRFMPLSWRWLPVLGLAIFTAATTYAQQDDAVLQRMKKDVFFLASPECEGRGVDTKGINIAADYIVNNIKQAGLKPGGKEGTYFQPFVIMAKGGGAGGVKGVSTLTLKGPPGQTVELVVNKDFQALPGLGSGKVESAIVFAGYGVTVPGGDGKAKVSDAAAKKDAPTKKDAAPPAKEASAAGYDDFKGVDIKGKIVVVLRRVPRWNNTDAPFAGDQEAYQGLETKIANAERNGAAAVIVVNDRSEVSGGDKFMTGTTTKAKVPVFQLRRAVLDNMLVTSKNTTLENLEKDIDRDLKPRSGLVGGWSATLATTEKLPSFSAKNIVGVLEGSGPLANETVVLGSHYDHLGYGLNKKGDKIYPGADDNGSGSTTVMELARRFGAIKNRQGRRLVFLWFSGEERGLLGSKHYCEDPMFPLENTIAMMNLDMVGRVKDEKEPQLYAEGFNTGKGLKEMLDGLNKNYGFKIVGPHPQNIYGRSDQASFYRKNVPGMFFFSDFHPDYHKTGDTPDKINVAGMAKVAGLTEKVVAYLAEMPKRPEYVAGAIKAGGKGGAGGQPATGRLNIVADGTDTTGKGVRIEAVNKGGAADKAGIVAGDRITAIDAAPIPGVNAYFEAVQKLRPGVVVTVTIDRKGMEMKMKVTPQ